MNQFEIRKAMTHILTKYQGQPAMRNRLLKDLATVVQFDSKPSLPQYQPKPIRMRTKFEDAASIVGPEIAAQLERDYRAVLAEKSGLVREMNGQQMRGFTSDQIATLSTRRGR